MPVIPTFSSYAPAPNLAQSYLAQQRLQQEAAADAARIGLGYAQLQQRAVENEMQLAAQKETLAKENLRKAQEAEVEKAYRESQLGIAQRQLQQQELVNQMKVKEAAQQMDAAQQYQRMVDAGVPPDAAMRRVGFGTPGFASVIAPQKTSDLAASKFQYQIYEGQIRDLQQPYQGVTAALMPPEVKSQIEDLRKKQSALAPMQAAQTSTGTFPAQVSVQPGAAPAGRGFIGTPGGTNVYQAPLPPGTMIPPMPTGPNVFPEGVRPATGVVKRWVRDKTGKLVKEE